MASNILRTFKFISVLQVILANQTDFQIGTTLRTTAFPKGRVNLVLTAITLNVTFKLQTSMDGANRSTVATALPLAGASTVTLEGSNLLVYTRVAYTSDGTGGGNVTAASGVFRNY